MKPLLISSTRLYIIQKDHGVWIRSGNENHKGLGTHKKKWNH